MSGTAGGYNIAGTWYVGASGTGTECGYNGGQAQSVRGRPPSLYEVQRPDCMVLRGVLRVVLRVVLRGVLREVQY
eukprot:177750-Rhodomonas_salina.1